MRIAEHVESAIAKIEPIADSNPIILIDGRAGAGKSEFAKALQNELFRALEQAPRLITMEDFYSGWEGLNDGALRLIREILIPLGKTNEAFWHPFDWQRGVLSETLSSFRKQTPLIIEGCGSLSLASSELADFRIWIEAPEEIRKQRFSDRDDGLFDDYFETWSAQEDSFYSTHRSAELADLRIRNL